MDLLKHMERFQTEGEEKFGMYVCAHMQQQYSDTRSR